MSDGKLLWRIERLDPSADSKFEIHCPRGQQMTGALSAHTTPSLCVSAHRPRPAMPWSAHPAYAAAYAEQRARNNAPKRPGQRARVLAFLRAKQNANTSRAYASGLRQFSHWVHTVENPQCSAAEQVRVERPLEHQVAAYMQYMVETRGLAMSTVNTRVNAISDSVRFDTSASYQPTNGAIITQMRAVLMPMTKPRTQKREITRAQLHAIVTSTRAAPDTTSRRDACMFMLAFSTFLRVSEVVRMNRGDITFATSRVGTATRVIMHVHVDRMRKNDKQRLGHERLVAATTAPIDIVRMMQSYLRATHGPATAPLFPSVARRTAGKRLALSTPGGRLHVWLKAVGVSDAKAYGFHSMRAGGATHAARAGVAIRHIKAHGNWKSDAVNAYVRLDLADRLRASDALTSTAGDI